MQSDLENAPRKDGGSYLVAARVVERNMPIESVRTQIEQAPAGARELADPNHHRRAVVPARSTYGVRPVVPGTLCGLVPTYYIALLTGEGTLDACP